MHVKNQCSIPLKTDFLHGAIHNIFQGELQRDNLYKDAKVKFDQMKIDLANRKTRLCENVNFKFMVDWIMYVRGLSGDQT